MIVQKTEWNSKVTFVLLIRLWNLIEFREWKGKNRIKFHWRRWKRVLLREKEYTSEQAVLRKSRHIPVEPRDWAAMGKETEEFAKGFSPHCTM